MLLLLLPVVDTQRMVCLMEVLSLMLFAVSNTDVCCCHDEVLVKLDH